MNTDKEKHFLNQQTKVYERKQAFKDGIGLKVELEVRRLDVIYKRRRYQVEHRVVNGSGLFVYSGNRLIYSTWNQEVNTKEGIEVEEAYNEYRSIQQARMYDLD